MCSSSKHSPTMVIPVPYNTLLIIGIGHEGLGKFDAALETYLRASDYIHASQPSASYYSVQHWINKIMYRLCILSLRLQKSNEFLLHFRRYKQLVDTNFKINFGSRERLAVYYWYWRSLSDIVKQKIEQGALEMNEKSSANGDARYFCSSRGLW